MTASTFQLRLHNTPSNNHSTSVTLYSHGQSANGGALLPRLAERKSGGKLAILPINMTNGIGSEISESIVTSEKQKRKNSSERGNKVYVSYLQTSLSTNWKRSLSQESNEKASQKQAVFDENEMSSKQKNIFNVKKSERKKTQTQGLDESATNSKDSNIHGSTSGNTDSDPSKRKVGKRQEHRLQRQDSNVSIQQAKGKQLSFISSNTNTGPGCVTSYSQTDLNAPKTCTSYVYIKSKFNVHSSNKNTVVVQKTPLCRSITISEASLSSAMTRQANISSTGSRSKPRNTSSRTPAISVQNKNKRSFTISNDTTDGRLRTIYESTLEEISD